MRFPELSTILRKNGATYLTYPAAFAYSTGLAHWESLLRARAIETQAYVIAPAQIGYHNEKRRSYGHAMVSSLSYRQFQMTSTLCDSVFSRWLIRGEKL